MDRPGTRRSARGRAADDSPRCREAALARLSGRGRPGGCRGLSPRRGGRVAAAVARRRRGRRRGARPAHGRLRVDRGDRGDFDPRAGQARAGPARATAAQGPGAQRRDLGIRRRRPSDRRRRGRDARRRLPRRGQVALRLCSQGRNRDQAQHRTVRGCLQRLALVPGRVRPRPGRLADVPHRSDPRPGASRDPRPATDRAGRRSGRLRQGAAADQRR